ncbi:DNA repair protein RecO [Halanaerobiaceae bacterium Z-7014]|uniref:DNA repair protein RecO n=1 Tax=Halonatronomonas betaini TaxID=2778430 RepID=A0A931ASX0_9FIRM|nr:DNA repair protein RecO [Halonatronomonas betaini]
MAEKVTEAVVLKRSDLGEKDQLVTFYTKDAGLLRLAFSGGKSFKSSYLGLVQSFNWLNLTYFQGEGLGKIIDVESKYNFPGVKNDYNKLSYGNYILEFYYLTGTAEKNPLYFNHLILSLIKLEGIERDIQFKKLMVIFNTAALSLLGYPLQLADCDNCQALSGNKDYYFLIDEGRFFCNKCNPASLNSEHSVSLNKNQVKFLLRSKAKGFGADKFPAIADNSFNKLNKLLLDFIKYHLDLDFKALSMLDLYR